MTSPCIVNLFGSAAWPPIFPPHMNCPDGASIFSWLKAITDPASGTNLFSLCSVQFSSVQSLSYVWLFSTPWIAAHQCSNSRSLPKLTSIESVMPSSHLILCRPLFLLPPIPPSIRVFSSESTLAWGGLSTGVSASASVLPMNIHDWFPLGWTGWIFSWYMGYSPWGDKELDKTA